MGMTPETTKKARKMSKLSKNVAAFSAKNLVISVSEMRNYGEKRAENPETSKGFENLSQLSDAKIAEIIGSANTPRKAKYRVSGIVGMSISFSMRKDWAKISSDKTFKIEENADTLVLRRFQKTKISS